MPIDERSAIRGHLCAVQDITRDYALGVTDVEALADLENGLARIAEAQMWICAAISKIERRGGRHAA